jgi:hypothetical protein
MAGEATRWQRGRSGNPGGRTKAAAHVAKLVREATDDGRELVKTIAAISRGEIPTMASERSQTWALEWLADRVFGRAAMSVELSFGDDAPPKRRNYDRLTLQELEQLTELMGKLEQPSDELKALRAAPLAPPSPCSASRRQSQR